MPTREGDDKDAESSFAVLTKQLLAVPLEAVREAEAQERTARRKAPSGGSEAEPSESPDKLAEGDAPSNAPAPSAPPKWLDR